MLEIICIHTNGAQKSLENKNEQRVPFNSVHFQLEKAVQVE